jgi:uncharacterized membrane protein (UPF0127 family)
VQVLDGQPVAVVPPRDELQQIIDAALGEERFTLDAARYVRFVVHEAFHAFQITTMAGELPDFGLREEEREVLPALGAPDLTSGVVAEGRLLARGLRGGGDADALSAASEFLQERRTRHAGMSADAIALEHSLEWTEGLARYADIGLMEGASGAYRPMPAFAQQEAYPPAGAAERELLRWLDDIASVPGTVRDRYYELGAGQASLLDRLMPGWQWRAMPGGEALESLLAMAVDRADSGVVPALRVLEHRRVRVGDRELEVGVADRPVLWARGLAGVDRVSPLDGLLFIFPGAVRAPFTNRGALIDLDVTFFDDRGRVVDGFEMTACAQGTCRIFEAAKAYRYALEVPAGTMPSPGAEDVLDLGADR